MVPLFLSLAGLSTLLAVNTLTHASPALRPTMPADEAPISELWVPPDDLVTRDAFAGPWGLQYAPDPSATYTFVNAKAKGVNPGMTVTDSRGWTWKVKQPPPHGWEPEGPIEVAISRVLSAVGYHQPPVYYLDSFTLRQGKSTRLEPGGRFRLEHESFVDVGEWSWHENPFVGSDPYAGLLVILLMMNSSDLKGSNNTLYRLPSGGHAYVVRDLGCALGATGRFATRRGDIDRFERLPFVTGVDQGFVRFEFRGRHKELIENRLRPAHVRWASELLGRLTERQWHDAFRAGGYPPELAERYIRRIAAKIEEGQRLGG